MPSASQMTTVDLWAIVKEGPEFEGVIPWQDAVDELDFRLCPENYSVEALRGGIRPTHMPTH